MTETDIVRQLAANFLVTMFFVAVWATLFSEVARLSSRVRSIVVGLFMGMAAVVSLVYTVDLGGGYVADLRSVPVAIAGLYAGPPAALVAVLLTLAARLWIGGAGIGYGALGIVLSGCVGPAAFYYCRNKPPLARAVLFSLALVVIPAIPALFTLRIGPTLLTVSLFKLIGAGVSVYALERAHIRAKERQLLDAAIGVAPDYLYIKDPQGRLVAYSQAVAEIYQSDRTGLIGKTDVDLRPGPRGQQLYDDEQALLAQGRSLRGVVDWATIDGRTHWYQSSKTMVTDADGKIIGLVGITRDVTDERQRQREVEDAAELWSLVLSQMADGVALFDKECNFVFCNEQYHRMFEITRDIRKPGVSLRHVLETAVARGEQVREPNLTPAEWIDAVINRIIDQEDEEVRLANGAYVLIRNREIPNLGYVSVAIDITAMRETENDLAELTGRLAALAATDPLTGLANRRALDELFSREMARAIRHKTWISAIMLDVDRFKKYNDLYGHGFGDSCLKLLAETMKTVASRKTDIVARYGGEEFCLILPDTNEAGAMAIAERLRQAVLDLAIPHDGSDTGVVTVSLGVAAYPPDQRVRTCEDLLIRADQALYAAKNAGRNQTVIGQIAA